MLREPLAGDESSPPRYAARTVLSREDSVRIVIDGREFGEFRASNLAATTP